MENVCVCLPALHRALVCWRAYDDLPLVTGHSVHDVIKEKIHVLFSSSGSCMGPSMMPAQLQNSSGVAYKPLEDSLFPLQ